MFLRARCSRSSAARRMASFLFLIVTREKSRRWAAYVHDDDVKARAWKVLRGGWNAGRRIISASSRKPGTEPGNLRALIILVLNSSFIAELVFSGVVCTLYSPSTQAHIMDWLSESEPDEDLPKIVAERYEVLQKIGQGGGGRSLSSYTCYEYSAREFLGVVHLGRDKYSSDEVAIKLHANDDDHPGSLQHEAQVLRMMAGRLGIPRLYFFTKEPHYTALVTELLGGNLHALYGCCSRQFSLKTVLMVAEQAVSCFNPVRKEWDYV